MAVELGLDTFGDITRHPDGTAKRADEVLRDVVDEAVVADQAGVDFIGLGEHHRPDFAISSPEVVLAAIAGRTSRIRLGTAVTVLSTDDPVRAFQRFSTLNAVSNGRAEAIVGRGSFTESYPLFGFDLNDYDLLFEETAGSLRPSRPGQGSQLGGPDPHRTDPRPCATAAWPGGHGGLGRCRWQPGIGCAGGAPGPAADAGDHRRRSAALPALYRPLPTRLRPDGHASAPGRRAFARLCCGDRRSSAREAVWPHYQEMFGRIGRERGWPPTTKERYLAEVDQGSLYVGSVDTVARKIAATVRDLGLQRFDMKYSTGALPHGQLVDGIALYGEKVIPMVRDMLATDKRH